MIAAAWDMSPVSAVALGIIRGTRLVGQGFQLWLPYVAEDGSALSAVIFPLTYATSSLDLQISDQIVDLRTAQNTSEGGHRGEAILDDSLRL